MQAPADAVVTGSIAPQDQPDGVVNPPVVNPPPGPTLSRHRDNGIGNGIDPAPGNSDITNGDAADGSDSGRSGPAGAQDNTAANGDPAGAGNNGNDGANTTTAAASAPGNSGSAPGHNK